MQVDSNAVPGQYAGHAEIDDGSGAALSTGGGFSLTVASTIGQALATLADLRSTVGELVPEAGLANSLVAKLDAVKNSVLALQITPALNQLSAFGHEVDALQQTGRVSGAAANIMKTKHDTVKNSISNVR